MTFNVHLLRAGDENTYRLGIFGNRSEMERVAELNRETSEHSGQFRPFSPYAIQAQSYPSKEDAQIGWGNAKAALKAAGAIFDPVYPTIFRFAGKPVI